MIPKHIQTSGFIHHVVSDIDSRIHGNVIGYDYCALSSRVNNHVFEKMGLPTQIVGVVLAARHIVEGRDQQLEIMVGTGDESAGIDAMSPGHVVTMVRLDGRWHLVDCTLLQLHHRNAKYTNMVFPELPVVVTPTELTDERLPDSFGIRIQSDDANFDGTVQLHYRSINTHGPLWCADGLDMTADIDRIVQSLHRTSEMIVHADHDQHREIVVAVDRARIDVLPPLKEWDSQN